MSVCGRPEGSKKIEGAERVVEVLPCVRPVDAAVHTPLAHMEFEDQVQVGFARSKRSGHFCFPDPASPTFLARAVLGSLAGHHAGRRRRTAVLTLVASLLAAAASLSFVHAPMPATAALVLPMGAENAVFKRDGEVSIGLTYMTGTLVKAGRRISAALVGGDKIAFVPYLLLWAGLVAGAVAGSAIYPLIGLQGLWIAVAGVAIIAAIFRGPDRQ